MSKRAMCVAMVASVLAVLLPTAAQALQIEPGAIGVQVQTRNLADIFAPPGSGLGDSEDHNEVLTDAGTGTPGTASSDYLYPPTSSPDTSLDCVDPCAGWDASAHASADVAAGTLKAYASNDMFIKSPNCCGGAAGGVDTWGDAVINDTITLSDAATVELQGSLEGALQAWNNDYDNQGNDPDAEVLASAQFRGDNDGPCEEEWCPPFQEFGGYSNELSVTPDHFDGPCVSCVISTDAVSDPFTIQVALPAGTSYFNARLAASIDYQVFGYTDRTAHKGAKLDLANSLTFNIVVPPGVSATSGSGLLPITTSTTVPGKPQGVSAVAVSATSAEVSFSPPASDGGSPITKYRAQCVSSDGGTTRAALGPASPLTVINLTPTSTYRCRVRAINAEGSGPYSAKSAAFVP